MNYAEWLPGDGSGNTNRCFISAQGEYFCKKAVHENFVPASSDDDNESLGEIERKIDGLQNKKSRVELVAKNKQVEATKLHDSNKPNSRPT